MTFESPLPQACHSVPCELEPDHDGPHRSNMVVWHDPPRILVGGQPPDLGTDTEAWVNGDVVLSGEEPSL